jgi:hypothetical protein
MDLNSTCTLAHPFRLVTTSCFNTPLFLYENSTEESRSKEQRITQINKSAWSWANSLHGQNEPYPITITIKLTVVLND